jgi:hypothetical protein
VSALRQIAEQYLAIRRNLGFKLVDHGRLVIQFADYLDDVGAAQITTEEALFWLRFRTTASPFRQRQRLAAVREFAQYVQSIDSLSRRGIRRRRTRSMPRQRQKRALYTYHEDDGRSSPSLDAHPPWPDRRPAFAKPWHGPSSDPQRHLAHRRQARVNRQPELPVACRKTRHTTRAPPHCCHDPAPRRCRPGNHRALARPREHRVHQHLPPRRYGAQRAGTRSHVPAQRADRSLPPLRRAARLLGTPVIMLRIQLRSLPGASAARKDRHIIRGAT